MEEWTTTDPDGSWPRSRPTYPAHNQAESSSGDIAAASSPLCNNSLPDPGGQTAGGGPSPWPPRLFISLRRVTRPAGPGGPIIF